MSSPCTNMKALSGKLMATILPRPADTVRHSEELTPKSFYASQILLCSEKFVLNI